MAGFRSQVSGFLLCAASRALREQRLETGRRSAPAYGGVDGSGLFGLICRMMCDTQVVADRLARLRPELDRIGVKTLHLFGSRARGDARVDSDWDFLVEFANAPGFDQFMDLKLLLEDQLDGRVDLLSRTACGQRLLRAIEQELVHAA